MSKHLFFVVLLTSGLWATDAQYNRGEMLYFSKVCNGCHGSSAEGGGSAPRLAGKTIPYIKTKLQYFRKAKVSTQRQEVMVQFALKLSDENIDDLSYFLFHHKGNDTKDVSSELLGGFGS